MNNRRLSAEEVLKVPRLLRDGHTASSISRLYGVSPAAIRNLIQEERWRRFSDEPPGQPERCPDCGGMVADDTLPCHVCDLRQKLGLDVSNSFASI